MRETIGLFPASAEILMMFLLAAMMIVVNLWSASNKLSICTALQTTMGKPFSWHLLGQSLCPMINKGAHTEKKKKIEQIRDIRWYHIGDNHSHPYVEQKR